MRRRLIPFVLSAGLLFAMALLVRTAPLPLTGVVRDEPSEVAPHVTAAAKTVRADEPRQSTDTYRADAMNSRRLMSITILALNGYRFQHLVEPAPRMGYARKGPATPEIMDAWGGFTMLPAGTREVFETPGGREFSQRAVVRQFGLGNIAPAPFVSVRLDDGKAAYRFGKELIGVTHGGVQPDVQASGFSVPVVAGLSTGRILRTAPRRYS